MNGAKKKSENETVHFKLLYLRWPGSAAALPVTNITDINNFCKYSHKVTVSGLGYLFLSSPLVVSET